MEGLKYYWYWKLSILFGSKGKKRQRHLALLSRSFHEFSTPRFGIFLFWKKFGQDVVNGGGISTKGKLASIQPSPQKQMDGKNDDPQAANLEKKKPVLFGISSEKSIHLRPILSTYLLEILMILKVLPRSADLKK